MKSSKYVLFISAISILFACNSSSKNTSDSDSTKKDTIGDNYNPATPVAPNSQ